MRAEAERAGRDPGALSYTRWGSTEMGADDVAALAAAGVHRVVVSPGSSEPADRLRELELFARRVGLEPSAEPAGGS